MKLPEARSCEPRQERCRAFELDALRGLALLLMILHHFIFDLRYILNIDVFAWQDTNWFAYLLRPFFLNVFLIVSGICCTFSRSNLRRGARLLLVAFIFTAGTVIFSRVSGFSFYIIFNVLHVLAIGILIYAALTWPERRLGRKIPAVDAALMLLSVTIIYLAALLPHWPFTVSYLHLPLGLIPAGVVPMSDYLPLLPWLGFFLIGAQIGRVVYPHRQSAIASPPRWLLYLSWPFEFLGRHSLLVYVLHQPVLLAVLFSLRALGLI